MSTSDPLMTRNPLDLLEIRTLIARHLTKGDLTRCVLVSQTWKDFFLPLIWRETQFCRDRIPPPRDVLHRHRHLVQVLGIDSFFGGKYDTLEFPNLQLIELNRVIAREHAEIATSFSLNPTVNHLVLILTSIPWSTLLKLPNLKTLDVRSRSFDKTLNSDFWELCTQLEQLIINETNFPGLPEDAVFPKMRRLEIEMFGPDPELNLVEFASRCPKLEVIFLPIGAKVTRPMTHEFTRYAVAGRWSNLKDLCFASFDIPDEDVAGVLRSMDQCYKWNVGTSGFGPRSFEVFQRHFPWIQALSLQKCPSITSEMIQGILSSSPQLEKFSGNRIDARHVANGEPWVCSSMTEFSLTIDFEPASKSVNAVEMIDGINMSETIETSEKRAGSMENNRMSRLQRRVFEQLSIMTNIRRLSVGFESNSMFCSGVDFRLCMGLDMLRELRRLRILDFQGTQQTMNQEEVDWMLKHWKNLVFVSGPFDSVDDVRNAELLTMLQQQKIHTLRKY